MSETTSQPAGPAADAQGRSSIDPTKNVETLVEAESKYLQAIQKGHDRVNRERDRGERRLTKERMRAIRHDIKVAERIRKEQKKDIEKGRAQLEGATEKALAAALAAQKEAVKEQTTASTTANDKTEKNVTEQLIQLRENQSTVMKPLVDGQSDLKERVGNLETRGMTAVENREASKARIAMIVSLITLGLFTFFQTLGFVLYIIYQS